MKPSLLAEILELPVAERMKLVEAIWDSISAGSEALPLTQWQRKELDLRLALRPRPAPVSCFLF